MENKHDFDSKELRALFDNIKEEKVKNFSKKHQREDLHGTAVSLARSSVLITKDYL